MEEYTEPASLPTGLHDSRTKPAGAERNRFVTRGIITAPGAEEDEAMRVEQVCAVLALADFLSGALPDQPTRVRNAA